MKISKKVLALIILVSGIIGFLVVLPVHYALEETSGEKFCVVCHEMDPMVIAYSNDVHSGKGKSGGRAKCVDCHIPHDNLAKYVLTKAKNGVMEGYIHFFKDPEAIDWHKNREKREHFVFDNGCVSCHTNLVDNKLTSAQAQKMHAHYQSLLNTDKQLTCASCHAEVGHSGLNNMLNYWKPEYKIYEKKAAIKRNFERLPEPFEKNKLTLLTESDKNITTANLSDKKEEFLKDLPSIDLSLKPDKVLPELKVDTIISTFDKADLERESKQNNREVIYENKVNEDKLQEPAVKQLEFLDKKASKKRNIIGQIFDTYWIVEFDKSMYIIDQHAAHEKVLYERFLKQFEKEELSSQLISPTTVISLSSTEADAVEKHLPSLKKLGFEIEHFGGREYSISAIPNILPSVNKEVWLGELISELLEVDSVKNTESILEKIASMSCKAAIKGNQKISFEEAKILIDELLELENPYNCPHGRPTVIKMTKTEIEKKFKRIV